MKKTMTIFGVILIASLILTSCGGISIESDAKKYAELWTSKNLDVSTFRNGDSIPQARTDAEWQEAANNKKPAWCNYDNNPNRGTRYGKLYNWYAVNDPRGLAPKGFHIPTQDEWTVLTDYLGGKTVYNTNRVAGAKMKDTGTRYWKASPMKGAPGTNESGFSGLPGGMRHFAPFANFAACSNSEINGYWWSSTESSTTDAWSYSLWFNDACIRNNHYDKGSGFSVRCIKD